MASEKGIWLKALKGGAKEVIESNKAIVDLVDSWTGLPSFGKELFTGSKKLGVAAEKAGYTYINEAGKKAYNPAKIAGGYMGASAGARVVTGGGLYKDRAGNTNIIGLPFI